ncbi:MAG: TIGR01440 family protein [Oscillospiraceae bacterium]|nr:TIGR01440 family protein [Oscillospiraceae bacterium]
MENTASPSADLLLELAFSARNVALELCASANLKTGQAVVVGCSTSEIAGHSLGTNSSIDIGNAVFSALLSVFSEKGVYMAVQCCEHLNRAIITQREAAMGYEIVNVVPVPNAGGAFATAAFASLPNPVALESFAADAGLDIGMTLIGMHLKKVAVPLRLETTHIGKALVIAAKTRPKLIGGSRAQYLDNI